MRTIKINYNETFASKHSRDYYRGKSFHFSGKWMQGTHYISDDYNIDFVVHGQTLLACAKSHLSTLENEPIDYIRDERGTIIGVVSAYWDFVVSGIIGKSPGIKIENNYWYTCEDTSIQNPIWINTGVKASLEYEDLTPEQIAELQRFAVELVDDFINNVIVQDEGQNTDKVMSQNAVTSALSGKVDNDLVPAEASSSNQLADKEWVDTNKQDTLVSGTNIQTINGHSILDSGNFDIQAEIKANEPFPETWNINSSLFNLVSDIRQDTDAVQGKVYLSTVYLNDLPAGMLQAEMKVEVLQSSGIGKVLRLTITSEDQSPYYWQCTAAYDRIGEWITFVPSDEAVQTPDWDQSDSSARDYIKNKPTNLSDFTDDLGSSPIHTHSQYDTAISGITEKIPNAASSSNQLADKNFVNSSIATSTATFRGTSATGLTEQEFLAWANALIKDDNDYIYWNTVDLVGNVQFKRYKYDGSAWVYEYTLNNSSFTADEWAAIQSRITSNLVTKLSELPTNANLNAALNNKVDKVSGKGLSTNDYTTEEKTKLSGIASGAQVNVLEGVQVDGTDLTITNKKVNVDLSGKTDVPESVTVDTSFTFRKTGDGLNIDAKNALIKGIKGRTDAWNQMVSANSYTNTQADSATINIRGQFMNGNTAVSTVIGPNYTPVAGAFPRWRVTAPSGANRFRLQHSGAQRDFNIVDIAVTAGHIYIVSAYFKGVDTTTIGGLKVDNIILADLTLMYGSGKEPSTAAAFLSDYPYAFGASYNAGKLLGNSVTGMETTGLNQWDEQYEGGTLDTSTGANAASSTRIRSKGYVQILPNTAYYLKSSATDTGTWRICYYDASKSFITGAFAYANQALSASPANAAFMRFSPSDAYGTTYKSDICINLSDASVNGTYEPYNRTRRELPITTSTGKLNGAGASQVVFPNGLNGVGTSFDEIVVENGLAKKGIVRRARVDLGTLNWKASTLTNCFYAENVGFVSDTYDFICTKYLVGTSHDFQDKKITSYGMILRVKDTSYSDVASFKAAMSGVYLDYPLATPQTFIFDTPFPVIYPVHANGTEEATPIGLDANGVPESTPFVGTIFYKEAFEDIYVQDLIVDKIAVCTGTKNEFLKADGSLDDITETGAQINIIEAIEVNNTALTPTNKTVNITVPTKTSDLTNDDNVVKDASYVHTDNNYTSAEKTKLSNALTTPTTVSKTDQSFAYRAIENGVVPTGTASIAKIKGRTDAWNQLGIAFGANTDTSVTPNTMRSDSFTITHNTTAATSAAFYYYGTQGIVVGHKYLVCMDVYADEALTLTAFGNNWAQIKNIAVTTAKQRFEFTYQLNSFTAGVFLYFGIGAHATSGAKIYLSNAILVDLTLKDGAGREPATVAAFLAEYPEALTAPYNAGKLIPNKMTALVTDGFNQWDGGVSVEGHYLAANGEERVAAVNNISSYVRVIPGETYYLQSFPQASLGNLGALCWYDANKNYISGTAFANSNAFTTTAPANAMFARFTIASSGAYQYNFNLSHSGIRNGEYEPYWQSTLNIDHSKIYGKLNGAGEMVQIAPNGFRGVGGNYDEVDIVRTEAYIRRAWVDMGTLNWELNSSKGFFYAVAPSGVNAWDATSVGNAICSRYTPTTPYRAYEQAGNYNKCFSISSYWSQSNVYIVVIDTAYANAAAFKTAMDGVMLDYQLATPLHYTDLMYSEDGGQTFTELPSNYRVDDFGTERRLPDGLVDGAPASSPLVADIVYNSTIIKDVNVGGILDYAKQTDVTRVANKKADKVLIDTTEPAGGMLPNTLYNFGTLSGNTTFTMATPVDNTVLNHWYWTFNVPSTVPTITWPNAITSWLGGSAPVISANKHYEISVLNGIAVYMEI